MMGETSLVGQRIRGWQAKKAIANKNTSLTQRQERSDSAPLIRPSVSDEELRPSVVRPLHESSSVVETFDTGGAAMVDTTPVTNSRMGYRGILSHRDMMEGEVSPEVTKLENRKIYDTVDSLGANISPQDKEKFKLALSKHEEILDETEEKYKPVYNEVVKEAGVVKPAFDSKASELAKASGVDYVENPLKGLRRLAEKAEFQGTSDPKDIKNDVKDIVRGSFVVSNAEQIKAMVELIGKHFDVANIKDRFGLGLTDKVIERPNGYHDVLVSVRLGNGLYGELQIHVPEMKKAKDDEYPYYQVERSLEAVSMHRELSSGEGELKKAVFEKQKEIYQPAWEAFKERTGFQGK